MSQEALKHLKELSKIIESMKDQSYNRCNEFISDLNAGIKNQYSKGAILQEPKLNRFDKNEITDWINNLMNILTKEIEGGNTDKKLLLWNDQLREMYSYYMGPNKKKSIISGNFYMKYFDLYPEMSLTLQIFDQKTGIVIHTAGLIDTQIKAILTSKGILESDILYLETKTDLQTDELSIDFAYQTNDPEFMDQDITAISNGRSYTGGSLTWNKVYLRGSKPNFNKPEIFDFPLTGFALPYNLPVGLHSEILNSIYKKLQPNGILADMRACAAVGDIVLKPMLNKLKELKWNRIFMPTEKWLLKNGNYIKY